MKNVDQLSLSFIELKSLSSMLSLPQIQAIHHAPQIVCCGEWSCAGSCLGSCVGQND